MSVAIEVRGLTKRHGAVTSVDGVTHSFAPGGITAVVGPSGSGKTTTLQLIAGLLEPDAGSVHVDGVDVTALPAHERGFGVVFQSYALFPNLDVVENAEFGLRVRGYARPERRRRALEALERTRVAHLAHRRVGALSGGEQQRVALARAIAFAPRVLLLDEPLSALDAQLREALRLELGALLRELRITAIHVTHDQVEALCLADELVVLAAGRIEQAGPPHEVYARPATPFVATFLGAANLVDGEVVRAGGHTAVRLPVAELEAPADAPAPGPCRVVIRPEDIEVARDGGVSAEVISAAFHGDQVRLGLAAGGALLRAVVPNDVASAVGDRVTLRFKPEKLRLLPRRVEA